MKMRSQAGSFTSTVVRVQPVLGGFDAGAYTSARLWTTADDGTRVPISVVHRRDVARDGRAPLLLGGYGAYEHSSESFAIQRGHGHLNVDDVFRREPRHRGRTDVVDTEGERPERLSKGGRDRRELGRPARFGLDDGDPPIHVRTLPA